MAKATVNITTLEKVAWVDGALCDYKLNGNNHIWRVNIALHQPFTDQFEGLLNADERQRAGRYQREKSKQQFVIARYALRLLLGKYLNTEPQSIVFENGENGKPYVNNTLGLHFNLSHSGNYVLIGLSLSDIGVDVEMINPHFEYRDVLSISYSEAETAYITKAANPVHAFYTLWTRKEARLKANGKSIDDIKQTEALNGEYRIEGLTKNLAVQSFDVDGLHLGCVAAAHRGCSFWNF